MSRFDLFQLHHGQLVVLALGLIIGLALYWFSRRGAQRKQIDPDLLNLFEDWRPENGKLGRR